MTVVLIFLVFSYTVFIMVAIYGWVNLSVPRIPSNYEAGTFISVLIAVRNEAGNIQDLLADLAAQQYPAHLMEVIFIDDHSDDGTTDLIQAFKKENNLALRVLQLGNGRGEGKKSAIAYGLEHARGELIVQTDGDCRLQPQWLKLIAYFYSAEGAKFISGPVCLQAEGSFFQKMQVVEFASLIGSGAASIGLGKPNMCNGANLAYDKEAFYAVNGFSGNEAIPSGDDEFLMHKIHAAYPGKVRFLKMAAAIVFTPASKTVRQFINQRIRWASKWKYYQNPASQGLALLVFAVNAMILAGAVACLAGYLEARVFWTIFFWKFAIEVVFLGLVLRFLNRENYLIYTLPLQLLYVPYVLFSALAGLAGTYIWKGRTHKNNDGH